MVYYFKYANRISDALANRSQSHHIFAVTGCFSLIILGQAMKRM